MQKFTLILFLSSLFMNTFFVLQAKTLPGSFFGARKMTKFRLYLQVIAGGVNRTEWVVAKSNLSDILPSEFGTVLVEDHQLTLGPEIESGEIARLQGIIALSDFRVISLSLLNTVVFTRGEYKGSTLSIVGRNPLMNKVREVSIVGGTGAFRMAQGYAITKTYSISEAGTHGVFEYNYVVYLCG